MVEVKEDVADALRCDTEDMILEEARQKRIEDGDRSDNEDTVGCIRTLEDKIQILRIADELEEEAHDHMLSRHLWQF